MSKQPKPASVMVGQTWRPTLYSAVDYTVVRIWQDTPNEEPYAIFQEFPRIHEPARSLLTDLHWEFISGPVDDYNPDAV